MKPGTIWMMLQPERGDWRYFKAEPPCNKGEIRMSFRWFSLTFGWQQRDRRGNRRMSERRSGKDRRTGCKGFDFKAERRSADRRKH